MNALVRCGVQHRRLLGAGSPLLGQRVVSNGVAHAIDVRGQASPKFSGYRAEVFRGFISFDQLFAEKSDLIFHTARHRGKFVLSRARVAIQEKQ